MPYDFVAQAFSFYRMVPDSPEMLVFCAPLSSDCNKKMYFVHEFETFEDYPAI